MKVREATKCDQEGCGVMNPPGSQMIYSPRHGKYFGIRCHAKKAEVHNCGGRLMPAKVTVNRSFSVFILDGSQCEVCGEEVISREVAAQMSDREKNPGGPDIYRRVPTNLPDGSPNPALPEYVRMQRE